jgi:hypothetical protein
VSTDPQGATPPAAKIHLEVDLDEFTVQALRSESERLGVSRQELVAFAIGYYLADLDSGRIARRIARAAGPASSRPHIP